GSALRGTRASISPRARRSSPSAPRRSPIRASRSAWRGSSRVAELIVAFDLPSGREALDLAARLPGLRWAKIGPVLHVREGPALVREFTARGARVFLDLKWHDIPSVVAGAVEAARAQGAGRAGGHPGGRGASGGAAVAVVGRGGARLRSARGGGGARAGLAGGGGRTGAPGVAGARRSRGGGAKL